MIKTIIILILSMTWTVVIKFFIIMVFFYSSWFNTGGCINNNLFLWYITGNSRSFPGFNCLYVTPRTLCYTNNENLRCNSTCNKTKNLGERKWIFLMPQMTVTISDDFAFPNKFITIKWTILVIKVSLISPNYVLSNSHFFFR